MTRRTENEVVDDVRQDGLKLGLLEWLKGEERLGERRGEERLKESLELSEGGVERGELRGHFRGVGGHGRSGRGNCPEKESARREFRRRGSGTQQSTRSLSWSVIPSFLSGEHD